MVWAAIRTCMIWSNKFVCFRSSKVLEPYRLWQMSMNRACFNSLVWECRYLQDKDVFERFYKQHLGKRLLMGKVTSDESERSLLSKLKTECGYQFTSRLEQMFTDIKTSHDTMAMFKAYLAENNTQLPCDLTVQVSSTPPCECLHEILYSRMF